MSTDRKQGTVPGPADDTAAGRVSSPLALVGGVVAVAAGIGLAELLAAVGSFLGITTTATSGSPLNALGATFIQFTPEWLKELAIKAFGVYDKVALRTGMGVTLVIVAALIGLLATRRLRAAMVAFGVLGLITVAAVVTRPQAGVLDALPTVLGVAGGITVLYLLFRPSTPAPVGDGERADDRRRFLRYTAGGAGLAVISGGLSRLLPTSAAAEDSVTSASQAAATASVEKMPALPAGAELDVAGITPFVTANQDFYRIDTAFVVPKLDATSWELRIHGMVDKEITIGYDDLVGRPLLERMVTLTCVSNEVGGDLAGNAVWQGPLIRDLLKEAAPHADADMVMSRSSDGFSAGTPLSVLLDDHRDAIFAITMNGTVLPFEHGFPVRMVVPGLYGYVSATKWVVELEVTRFDQQTSYWTDRGWSPMGPIKMSSRIDVPMSFQKVPAGKFAMGGVAWAQHTGISTVEVSIDNGPWQAVTLSTEATVDSWRQWSYVWDATPGQHTVTCRATDTSGAVQIEAIQQPIPDGSTGYDSTAFTVA